MDDREIRLECLRLAQRLPTQSQAEIINTARAMSDFVIGVHDAEIISAARSFANKVVSR